MDLANQPKAIVIGASSGIGKELAALLARNHYRVGVTGRRTALLEALAGAHPGTMLHRAFDITDLLACHQNLESLTRELGGLDLLVISAGTGEMNEALDFETERRTLDTNVTAFSFVAAWAYRYFEQQGSGHLVAISSVAGLRGSRAAPAYNASKAYQINYLEALRQKAVFSKKPIHVTDIRPGFVNTQMAKGEGIFWMADVEKASHQIWKAIRNKKKIAWVTRRWQIIAGLLKILPGAVYERM